MATATKKTAAQEQGVPVVYLNENGRFKVGMDARLKSDLVLSALGLITKANPGQSLHVFTKDQAEKLLQARGWTGFLDRKREILAQTEQRKAEREQEREERTRAAAEAKAEKKAEKADTGASASTTNGGERPTAKRDTGKQVKADPKPSGKQRTRSSGKKLAAAS